MTHVMQAIDEYQHIGDIEIILKEFWSKDVFQHLFSLRSCAVDFGGA